MLVLRVGERVPVNKRCYKVYKDYKERPSVKKCDC